jgi:hypothetical protein
MLNNLQDFTGKPLVDFLEHLEDFRTATKPIYYMSSSAIVLA